MNLDRDGRKLEGGADTPLRKLRAQLRDEELLIARSRARPSAFVAKAMGWDRTLRVIVRVIRENADRRYVIKETKNPEGEFLGYYAVHESLLKGR